jgi:hypothetical protein
MDMFNNLPGVIVNTVDGGLAVRRAPKAHSTLIIGTAGKGSADQPYQVVDPSKAALEFGFEGNLIRAMEEARGAGSDNLILFRMGTKAASLIGVGKDFATAKTMSKVARDSAGIVTITAASHGYVAGDIVKVAAVGAGNVSVNGEYAVATAVSGAFTYATAITDVLAENADLGSCYKLVTAGFTVSFSARSSDTATRYKVWYAAGVLAVWLDGNLVFSNADGASVDNGDVTITGLIAGNQGLALGTGGSPLLATAVTLTAAVSGGTVTDPAPTKVDAVTGVETANQTGRKLFIAFQKAADLLDGIQVEQLVVPDAKIDQPNIAFKVDAGDVVNNPVVNPDALDWLKTTSDAFGAKTYKWASDTVDSEGATVAAAGPFANPGARVTAAYNEVNWGFALANFAARVSKLANQCIAFIGTTAPKTFKLVDVRQWIGYLPTYNSNGVVTVAGAGLCGIPYLVGTTGAKLHAACWDAAAGRAPGFFETSEGQFDGSVLDDKNGNPVDIGAYLHVVADQGILSNGFSRAYAANLAPTVAGFCSMLDEKSALTNKPLRATQIPGLVYIPGQLDSLTQAKVNVLRNKGLNAPAAMLHDMSAATDASDYTTILHTRVKGRFVATLLQVADPFIGESSLDGLQLQALKTALDQALVELSKRGYGSNPNVVITTTPGEQRLGHATLDLTFRPADELIQLTAQVGLTRS